MALQFYHWGKSEQCAFGRRLDGPQRQSAYFGKQSLTDHKMYNKQTVKVSPCHLLLPHATSLVGWQTFPGSCPPPHFLSPLAHLVHLQTFVLIISIIRHTAHRHWLGLSAWQKWVLVFQITVIQFVVYLLNCCGEESDFSFLSITCLMQFLTSLLSFKSFSLCTPEDAVNPHLMT